MNKLEVKEFEFNLKTKTMFGIGTAANLGKYLEDFPFKKIGVIVDNNIGHLPHIKEIIKNIKTEKIKIVKIWEYNLNGEPDYDSLDKIKLEFIDKLSNPIVDCFVAIGGGSIIDFAKGLATLMTNKGKAILYRGFPKNLNPPLPTIAIPTTAGTASEVTYNAVFIDKQANKKLGINTMHNFPILAVIDPKLTLSCPQSVSVSSGGDALVHTMESYVAVQSNMFTRIFAKEAFKFLFNNIVGVVNEPDNLEIRSNLSFGSYLAGISLMNSGSGPAGALSYLLGPYFNVPHGIAGSVFLPYIVEHNINNGYDYSELYDLIDKVDKTIGKKRKNKIFLDKMFDVWKEIGIPSKLTSFGVNKNNINILLNEVEKFEAAFNQNPILFSVEDGKRLLLKMV